MKFRNLLASSLIVLTAVSCGENAQPGAQANLGAVTAVRSPGAQPQAQPSAARTAQGPQQSTGSVPPADARFTIFCDKLEGPAHVAQATMIKSRLMQTSGMNDWYVIHTEKDSTIFYGYYRDLDIPVEKHRADSDRARLAHLTDVRGNSVIRGNILVPVPTPDPTAPADWNLLNTPQDAYWTIEIATFAGDAMRKEAAVQAVRELRAQGETAYYYHGPTASSVCIGAWKRSAVAEQGTGINKEGATRDDAHTQSADQPLLVIDDIRPPNMPSRVLEPGTGKPMTVVALHLEIVDPTMKRAAENPLFKYHRVNYELRGVQEGQPDPSVLVVIPHDQSVAHEDDWRLSGGSGAPPAPQQAVQPPRPTSPGDNQLRSLGDR
jgi:hypothetical protein